MSLFSFRRNINEPTPQKDFGLKNFLAYRDTWQEIPSENFSMQRIIFRARYEKYKQLQQVKLIRTENGFRRKAKDELSAEDVFLRMVQASLNKLTEANYQAIVPSILVPEVIKNPNVLAGVVNLVFLKAVAEPVFSGLYARLIEDIDLFEDSLEITESPSDVKNEENVESVVGADSSVSPASAYGSMSSFPAANTFSDAIFTSSTAPSAAVSSSAAAPLKNKRSLVRKELVRRCQKFFDLFVKGEDVNDEEEKELLLKKNRANIKFSGELFMRSCVSERVIISVCKIVLFVPSAKLTDANVEMAISLLRVVGQKFDDSGKDSPKDERSPVWQRLAEIFTEKTVSQRIRFLIQNLLELRDNKWQPRAAGSLAPPSTTLTTVAATVRAGGNASGERQNPSESAVTTNKTNWGGNASTYNNNINNNANNRFHKASPNPSGAGTGGAGGRQSFISHSSAGKIHNRAGEHGETQKHSHSSSPPHSTTMNPMGSNSEMMDLSGGVAGTNLSASLNSPPFSSHSEGIFGEISAEDKKMLALASLPPAFTSEIEKSFLSAVRDAVTDGDWDAAAKTMKEKMKNQNVPEHTGAMCGAYTVVRHVATCTDASERMSFIDALTKCPCFDQSAVSRGFAWFFAHAIAKDLKDDYPLWHTRVNDALMAVKSMPFPLVLRDVFARTGNYLGALCAQDEMSIEQQEELLNVWSAWCKGWKAAHLNKGKGESEITEEPTAENDEEKSKATAMEEIDPMEVLDMLREVKQRPFLRDIMPDCLSDLLNEGFVTVDAVRQFVLKIEETPSSAKKVSEAAKVLSKQLTELIGDGETAAEE